MTLHAGDPVRLGGTATHNAGDFLGQASGAGGFGIGGIQVIERGFSPSDALGCGKATFMGGIVFGQQKVGFRQVLKVYKAVSLPHPRGDSFGIMLRSVAVQRPRTGRQPRRTSRLASGLGIVIKSFTHAKTIAARRWPVYGRIGPVLGIGVPIGRLIAATQGFDGLLKKGCQGGKDIAKQP